MNPTAARIIGMGLVIAGAYLIAASMEDRPRPDGGWADMTATLDPDPEGPDVTGAAGNLETVPAPAEGPWPAAEEG